MLECCQSRLEPQATDTQVFGIARAVLIALQSLPSEKAMTSYCNFLIAASLRVWSEGRKVLHRDLQTLSTLSSTNEWGLGQADAFLR
jgi:hypothetical protein